MMKIASISFYNLNNQKGGATTAAIAFAEWAKILGHECEIFYAGSITKSLNNYDAAFFSTPIPRTPSFGYENYEKLESSNINSKPFAMMIHVEDDIKKYGDNLQMFHHGNCKALINIDNKADFFKDWHENRIQWNPCCLPSDIAPSPSASINEAIIYAGRITPWKNAHLYKQYCDNFDITTQIFGRIDNKEYANEHKIRSFQYDKFNFSGDLLWAACGNKENKMIVKRAELVAFEALSNGMMPIVNINAMPDELKDVFIEIDVDNFDYKKLFFDIKEYRKYKNFMWNRMCGKLRSTSYSYEGCKKSIKQIIGALEC